MTVLHDFSGWPRGPLFVAIGVFDGVHLGHRALVGRTAERASAARGRAVATTFDPLPIQVLAPAAPPSALSDVEERVRRLADAGADDVAIFHFTKEFAAMSPEEFIRRIAGAGQVREVFVGQDFRFGHDRAGDVRMLAAAGPAHGFAVTVADPVASDGAVVSSTRIRNALVAGDIETAARLLGRPYTVTATVTRGAKHGSALGFPTIDLAVPPTRLLPREGIYAMWLHVRDQQLAAAASVGLRPAPSGADRTLEAFLLDRNGELSGEAVTATFVLRIRDEMRFEGAAELSAQIARDVNDTRRALGMTEDR